MLSQNPDFVRDSNEVWNDVHEGFTDPTPKPWPILGEYDAERINRDAYPEFYNECHLSTTPSDFYTM